MSKYQGFVSKIFQKHSKPGAKKAWTATNFKIEKDNGDEYEEFFSFGFDEPPFKEGDYIAFDAEEINGYITYTRGSGSRVKNPPARAGAKQPKAAQQSTMSQVRSNVGVDRVAAPAPTGADRQTQIVLQHSQEVATRVVVALIEAEALPMSAASTKAGEAKRFAEIMATIDKFTVKYYNDVVTARLLETVADTVIDTSADGPLPDVKKSVKDVVAEQEDNDAPSGAELDEAGGESERFE